MKLIVIAVFVVIYLAVSTVDCFQIDDEFHHQKLTPIHRIRKQDDGPIKDPIAPPVIQKNYTTPTLVGDSPENVRLSRDTAEAAKETPIAFRKLRDAPSEEASGQGAKPSNEGRSFRRIRDLHKDASAQSEEVPAKEEPRIFRRYFRDAKNQRGSRQAAQNEQSNPNAQAQEQSKTLTGDSQSQETSPQAQDVRTIRQTEVDQANQGPPKEEGSQVQEQPKAVRKYRQAEQPKQGSDSEGQPKALKISRQVPDPQSQKEENQSQEQPKAVRKSRQVPNSQPQKEQDQSQEQQKSLRGSRQLPDPPTQKEENQPQEQPKPLRTSRQIPDPQPQKEQNPSQEQPKPLRKSRQIPTEQNNPQPQKEDTQTGEQPKPFRRSRQTPPAEDPSKDASQAQEQPKTLRKARRNAPQETRNGEAKPEGAADQPRALRRSRQATNATEQASPEAPKQEQPSSLRRARQETKDESQPQDESRPGLRRVRQTEVIEGEMKPSSDEQKTIRKRRDEVGGPTKDVPSVPAPQEQAQAIRKARRDEEVGMMDSEESLYDEPKEFARDLRDALDSQEDNKNKDETSPSKESQQSLLRLIRNAFDARISPKRNTVGISLMEDFTNDNDHYYKLIQSRFARSDDEASLQHAASLANQEKQRFFRYAMGGTPVENAEKKTIREAIADETIDLVRMLRHANDETQEVPRDLQRRNVIIEDDEHGDGHGSSSFF